MKAEANVELRAVHADGGATRNRFLMQFIADIAGVELLVSRMPDCSSLGAAMAGALGRRAVDSLAALEAAPHEVEVFRPAMKPDLVEERYAGWKRAVHQVLAGTQ
jgi:glycerol kinase